MKVEKAETKFTPVVITLETQEEVDALSDLLALVSNECEATVHGSSGWKCKEFYSHFYDHIEQHSSDSGNFVYLGEITNNVITFK